MGECLNLFDGWDNLMIQSAREGRQGRFHCEGTRAAACENGDFLFLAGDTDAPEWEALLKRFSDLGYFRILVSRTPELHERVGQILKGSVTAETRYALHPPEAFDCEQLSRLVQQIPAEIELRLFDEACYHQALAQAWSCDACLQFGSWDSYRVYGLGIAALKDDVLIGSASSYSSCSQGIEIQVDVRHDHQRRGIAAACSARLILECMQRDLMPEWDAASDISLHLAQKLGYHYAGSYPVWFLNAPTTPEKE